MILQSRAGNSRLDVSIWSVHYGWRCALPHCTLSCLSSTVAERASTRRRLRMSMYPPIPDPPPVHTTELDCRADQARRDGWALSGGQWQHPDRVNSFDDGDWVYLGEGVWEDAFVASLPSAARARDHAEILGPPRLDAGRHRTDKAEPARAKPPTAGAASPGRSIARAGPRVVPHQRLPGGTGRGLQLATEGAAKGGKDHAAYNRALERTLRDYTEAGVHQLLIAPIRIRPFLAWCADRGRTRPTPERNTRRPDPPPARR